MCIHTCTCILIHAHQVINTNWREDTHTPTKNLFRHPTTQSTHTCIQIYLYTYAHTYTFMCIHTCIRTTIHAYQVIYTDWQEGTHTHTHTHTSRSVTQRHIRLKTEDAQSQHNVGFAFRHTYLYIYTYTVDPPTFLCSLYFSGWEQRSGIGTYIRICIYMHIYTCTHIFVCICHGMLPPQRWWGRRKWRLWLRGGRGSDP